MPEKQDAEHGDGKAERGQKRRRDDGVLCAAVFLRAGARYAYGAEDEQKKCCLFSEKAQGFSGKVLGVFGKELHLSFIFCGKDIAYSKITPYFCTAIKKNTLFLSSVG